ncbi:MAG: hypothetical protein Q9216_004768 [Gyalolechia sp. 2 TL-2023]
MTGTVEKMALERTAIAHLDPASAGPETEVEGVVTLIWPYSVSNRSFSMLLAEPDFRLRRQKGQVRIQFIGSSASAVSACDPKSGDSVTLRLLGAQWEKDETSSRTPGKGIEWQLRFEQRLVLRIQREGRQPVELDIDQSSPSPEPRVRTPPPPESLSMLRFSSTSGQSPGIPPRNQAWSTPAFLKRDRLSSTTFFGSDYDPFDEDEFRDNSRRKKTKFGRRSNEWRFTERGTSSESVSEAEMSTDQQPVADGTRNVQMKDHMLSNMSNNIDTERTVRSAEETLETPVTPDEAKAVGDDRQIVASTDKREILQGPVTASPIAKPSTVDEGVQTVHSGYESAEYAYQGGEAMSVNESAERRFRSKGPHRNGTDLQAGPAYEQRAANSMSSTAEVTRSLGLSEDEHPKTAKIDEKSPPDILSSVENELKDESKRGIASPAITRQTLGGALDEKRILAETSRYPEPTNDQDYQAGHAAEHPFLSEKSKPSDGKSYPDSTWASNYTAIIEAAEKTEEVQSTIDQAQEPSPSMVDQHPESSNSRLAEESSIASPLQDQELSPVEKSHIKRSIPPDFRSTDADVLEPVENYGLEGLSIPPDSHSSDVVQKPMVPQADTTSFMQDGNKLPDNPPLTEYIEDPQEQAEALEVLDESQGGDSSSEEDQLVDDSTQRLPGEADIEENWSSEEESYPDIENPEVENLSEEDEDIERFNRPVAAAVSQNPQVEVITLDESDEDDDTVAQSQTDGSVLSTPSKIRQLKQPAGIFWSSTETKGGLNLSPSNPFLRDSVPDSQPIPDPLELETPSEHVVPRTDAEKKSPQTLDSSGDQKSPMPLDINDFSTNEQAELQPVLPRECSTIENDIDPRLKNKVLTPNDTQPREDISQASAISLHSIEDTHDLPTPQLTQNRSSDILLPASLRPSSPAILSSSPPISPVKLRSSPTNDGASTAVGYVRKPRNNVLASPRQSLRSHRLSTVPASVSPWFAPKRSGIVPDSRSQSEVGSEAESEAKIRDGIYNSYDEDEEGTEYSHEEEIPSSVPESRAVSSTPQHLFRRKSPDKFLLSSPLATPPGLRTSHAYYAPLSTLSSHFSAATSTLSIVFAATPILRANSGPRDFYTTAYITDPSSLPATIHSTSVNPAPFFITASIFRPSRSSLPDPLTAGSVLLLRSFHVTSSNRAPSLISTNGSAWAVFHPHNPDPTISGPPIEFGAEERGYVRGLWEWWDQVDADVKADAMSAAEEKVRKAVRKDKREREKGRRLKGMGLRLAPGNEKATGKHELRGGKEWKDDVGSSPKGKGRGKKGHVRHELRDGKEWVDESHGDTLSSKPTPHSPFSPSPTSPTQIMPTKSFPINKSRRNHVNPLLTPYSILVSFRPNIWTLPKRDPVPTPPMSPRTKALEEGTVGEEIAQALARLAELMVETRGGEQKKEADDGTGKEEKADGEESDEGCVNPGCCGVKLGLRGGDTEVKSRGYIDYDGDGIEEIKEKNTLAWVKGYHVREHGSGRGDGSAVRKPRNQPIDVDVEESKGLRRVDRSTNLRGLKKRYDPDAESAYSRSTGGRSAPNVLIGDAENNQHANKRPVRLSRYRQHRIDMNRSAHDSQENVKITSERPCKLRASHAWRKRVHWAGAGGYGTLARCDGCHAVAYFGFATGEGWVKRMGDKMSRISGRHRIMGSWPKGSPRDDGFRSGLSVLSTHTLESSSKTSLTTSSNTKENNRLEGSRTFSATKRFAGDSTSGGKTPLNGITPLATTNVATPTTGASSAFGLGSGAFASFGSSAKTPKTPGTAIEQSHPTTTGRERDKDVARDTGVSDIQQKSSVSSLNSKALGAASEHPLRYTWIVWYRPPTSKFQDYEKSTIPLAHFSSAESFWTVYSHLKRPSTLPSVSDYHLFRKGIRPVWEDEENKRGGKWIVKLKKGVADRYWEDLLLAIVGDQFAEAGEEVCGAVLSVRSGEDVLSVWTRIDGGRNIKIRETIKRILAFPPDTNIVWKSHDDSIAQRSAIDQARQEKGAGGANHHGTGKRRQTMSEDPASEKAKA